MKPADYCLIIGFGAAFAGTWLVLSMGAAILLGGAALMWLGRSAYRSRV
jgi:hypothetical protein